MVLQAFIDESGKNDWFVLGGYIASAEAWAAFSKDWEQILPLGIRDKKGFHFTCMRRVGCQKGWKESRLSIE